MVASHGAAARWAVDDSHLGRAGGVSIPHPDARAALARDRRCLQGCRPSARKPPGSVFGCLSIAIRCPTAASRSEEHTSELQSRRDLVCRLLLEKKKKM